MIEQYLSNLTRVLGIGAAFATIPMVVSFADLQPPWPPAIGPVSGGLILISALAAWEWVRATHVQSRRSWFLWAAVLTASGLIFYLALYSLFIENLPGGAGRVVRGFSCTNDAWIVYGSACPDLPREALQNAEWEAERLWTRGSLTVVRIGMTVAWLTFVLGLVTAAGAIIAGRRFSNAKQSKA